MNNYSLSPAAVYVVEIYNFAYNVHFTEFYIQGNSVVHLLNVEEM